MSFQVATDAAKNGMIIAVGSQPDHHFPAGTDFGAAYPISVVEDDALYAEAVRTPAYLHADGTIHPAP